MPDRMNILLENTHIILPIMVMISIALLLGALRLRTQDSSTLLCMTLWFVFPLGFVVFGAILTPNEFNVRYSILSFPPFIAFLAVGIDSLRINWVRVGIVAAVVLISAFSLGNHYFNELYHKENSRAAGRFLCAHALPNDLIICSTGYTERDLKYYCTRKDLVTVRYPVGTLFVEPDRIDEELKEIIVGRDRFWLFLSRTFHSDPEGRIRSYFDGRFPRALELKAAGVELVLFETKESSTQLNKVDMSMSSGSVCAELGLPLIAQDVVPLNSSFRTGIPSDKE